MWSLSLLLYIFSWDHIHPPSFEKGCSQPVSVSRKCLIQCILSHSGILHLCQIWPLVMLLSCEQGSEASRALSLPHHLYGLGLGRVVNQSHFRAPVGNTKATGIVFVSDAVILAKFPTKIALSCMELKQISSGNQTNSEHDTLIQSGEHKEVDFISKLLHLPIFYECN